jgi:O-acetyl-ADP-ribose deacetylase (regulator of RNase III)
MLIDRLLSERDDLGYVRIPDDTEEQRDLLRSLMNVRPPGDADEEFLRIQDEYLSERTREKGVTDADRLKPSKSGLYVWQGDITTLRCGAIVNAANSQLLGCFVPCHNCIDNCIHTFSGIQLRRDCDEIMRRQGFEEPTGTAKITPAYNLPCEYVIHTVGPIVSGRLTKHHEDQLASCYRSCLEIAEEHGVKSIAFCCISTGVFMFPNQRAAEIAVATVKDYLKEHDGIEKVIFNVFKDMDLEIYDRLLNQ